MSVQWALSSRRSLWTPPPSTPRCCWQTHWQPLCSTWCAAVPAGRACAPAPRYPAWPGLALLPHRLLPSQPCPRLLAVRACLNLNPRRPPACPRPQAVFLLIGKTSALTMNIAGVIKVPCLGVAWAVHSLRSRATPMQHGPPGWRAATRACRPTHPLARPPTPLPSRLLLLSPGLDAHLLFLLPLPRARHPAQPVWLRILLHRRGGLQLAEAAGASSILYGCPPVPACVAHAGCKLERPVPAGGVQRQALRCVRRAAAAASRGGLNLSWALPLPATHIPLRPASASALLPHSCSEGKPWRRRLPATPAAETWMRKRASRCSTAARQTASPRGARNEAAFVFLKQYVPSSALTLCTDPSLVPLLLHAPTLLLPLLPPACCPLHSIPPYSYSYSPCRVPFARARPCLQRPAADCRHVL